MKSKIYRLRFMHILALIIIASSFIILAGCGKNNVKKQTLPPDVYYKNALFNIHKHNYSSAAKNLKALIENYPSYRHTKKAELKLGDVYYLEGKYIEAQGAYMDFIHLHPGSKHVPFAMFYTAMSYYKRKERAGRTQTPLIHSKLMFEKLISKYPYSKYSKSALKYIKIIDISLSENSFFTGLYYYNASLWKPAAYIFKTVLKQYKGLPIIPKTLYYLTVCYRNLNNKNMENRYKTILLKKYPQSKYSKFLH